MVVGGCLGGPSMAGDRVCGGAGVIAAARHRNCRKVSPEPQGGGVRGCLRLCVQYRTCWELTQ
jgi:hypothetical protein